MPSPHYTTEDYVAKSGQVVNVATGSRTVTITLPPRDSWPTLRDGRTAAAVSVNKIDAGRGVVRLVTSDGSVIDAPTTIDRHNLGYGLQTGDDGNWWLLFTSDPNIPSSPLPDAPGPLAVDTYRAEDGPRCYSCGRELSALDLADATTFDQPDLPRIYRCGECG